MSTTGAAFSVRFVRNGDQVMIVRDIINSNGDGAALFQVVDPTSGVVVPDWSIAANQPIIRLSVRSSAGFPAEITGVTWAYNGTNLNFTLNGTEWVTASNDERFKARINGSYYELKIVADLASSTEVANKQISYEVSFVCNAISDSVQGSADVLVQTAGSDSHILQITANRVELDETNDTATLTAVGMYGADPVTIGSNGYTIKWYQNGVELTGQTARTLTVTREMVEGGCIFIAKLFLNGNAVAQDSQRINDVADKYQITHTPTNAGSNYVAIGHNATFTLAVLRNGELYSGAVSYEWQVYNALGEAMASGTGDTVTVTPADCVCGVGESTEHYDADVQVTANF